MSRSRKKNSYSAITTFESEKDDKRRAHRRFRHSVRQLLHSDPEREVLPHWYDFSNPWSWDKDGKVYREEPEYRRK